MPRFFVDSGQIENRTATVFGEDAHHISRSLRMAAGETVTLCDGEGTDYLCRLTEFLRLIPSAFCRLCRKEISWTR